MCNIGYHDDLFSLLLNTVSDEDTQARTDRVMLTPWVKFLWESYRNILELTKNNQTFEKLYTEVAKEGMECVTMMMCNHGDVFALAFHFCIDYKRRTEFRKLCDTVSCSDVFLVLPLICTVSIVA